MYIQDRWRDDPPPCLHCVMIFGFWKQICKVNKQAAIGTNSWYQRLLVFPPFSDSVTYVAPGRLLGVSRALGRLLGGSWPALRMYS